MAIHQRTAMRVLLVTTIIAAVVSWACDKAVSPIQPKTPFPATTGVTLNSTVITVGKAVQGTVFLSAPASSDGATILLSSSNPAVATVPTSVSASAGASSAAFSVSTMAAGTATVVASYNGTAQSPMLTVTAPAIVLASLVLSDATVVGGNPVTGTATLSAPAPAAGAEVLLLGNEPVSVDTVLVVPAGLTSATFTVATHAVPIQIFSTINATYGGATASAVLTVMPVPAPPSAVAKFGVTGTSVTDTCAFVDNGKNLACTFDGSGSTAPGAIVGWDWSYAVATVLSQTTSESKLINPSASCDLVPAAPLPAGTVLQDDRDAPGAG